MEMDGAFVGMHKSRGAVPRNPLPCAPG